jgi:sugar lactone lactonase YvrE
VTDVGAQVVLEGRGYLEAPRWHGGELWLSDLHRHEVLAVAPDGTRVRVVAELDDQPSGLGFLPDGSALVVSLLKRRVLRVDDLGVHADLTELTIGATNDMVVDQRGRAYVGSFGYDLFGRAPKAPGNVVRVDPDGSARIVAEDLQFPNGMVITADGTLLVAETQASRITAFDLADDGSLSGRRVWCELPGRPDGVALDAEGALWVALPKEGIFVRVQEGGERLDEVPVRPGWRAVACELGGPGMHTLFMALALYEGDETSSVLESVVVDVPGLGPT